MYPEAVNLPFNSEILKNQFVSVPPGTMDPGGSGYWVAIQGNMLVVDGSADLPALPEGKRPLPFRIEGEPLYLGDWRNKPLRVIRLRKEEEVREPFVAEPFNAMTDRLDDALLTLGGLGQQVLYWQRQSTYCSRCGQPTTTIDGTWGKKCESCFSEHFPHIHPCVIVLVKRGESFLLARKPEWAPGRYSLIAGFVDFGESLEECVQREVLEEVGLKVGNIRYVGSQSWPFPSQLMVGYVADYAGGQITLDGAELEDARWFSSAARPEALPSKRSIARWIIDRYAVVEG